MYCKAAWAQEQIRKGAQETGRQERDVRIIAAGMLCVRDNGDEARRIVRNRIANRAHHNFRFTFETVPAGELAGVKRFMKDPPPDGFFGLRTTG